ncbi:SorT family sulfite dehydrogenase catalytic subunit [Marinobacter bohaiensis]|uniref:SorT family sulfite dehydrogenase catalytic subunit n=1 Tax=Marinobacter bohaiensis TaxID=2201898 RepID=UPI000DAEE56D|nr:sulfite oxidase [Marinobacter bohaiensis]
MPQHPTRRDAPTLSRRQILIGGAGTLASVSLLGLTPLARGQDALPIPDFIKWKRTDALIVHSNKTMETRRGAIGTGVVTPSDILFVRNNLPTPPETIVADRDAWEVAFSGVTAPRSMTLGELKTLGVETVATVLQCSGNGRAFFPHGASGSQWSVGAAGCVIWTGVPMREVIRALGGPESGAQYLTSTGGEELPEGLDEKSVVVERSVPLDAMEQALLAYEMNGEPLPLTHGGPLRMVIPGYYGVNNVKYVKHVALTRTQSDAKIQASGYRVRPVGEKGAPKQPSMWAMNVKSWITGPLDTAPAGRNLIHGVAFGGTESLHGVEVSLDNGENWRAAPFIGPDLGPFAWRPFVLAADLSAGEYRMVSRATDAKGNSQPRERPDNERGYGHNGWEDHGVTVTVS